MGKGGHEPRARIEARELRVLDRSIHGQSQRQIAAEEGLSQGRRVEDLAPPGTAGPRIFAAGRPAVVVVIFVVDVTVIMARAAPDHVPVLARYSPSARQIAA